jgi:short-subunit dehydrogenase
MEIGGSGVLIVGATGVLGAALARGLVKRGARVALAGRDQVRLESLADELDASHTEPFDAFDIDGCGELVRRSAEALGGLDAVLVASGVVAFGSAEATDDEIVEYLFTVNTLAPIALLRAALPLLPQGSVIGAITGVVSDKPSPRLAAYSASKAALSAWLAAVRAEQRRRGVSVLDARLPHMDTGLASRSLAGEPPRLPKPADQQEVVDRVLDALVSGTEEVR